TDMRNDLPDDRRRRQHDGRFGAEANCPDSRVLSPLGKCMDAHGAPPTRPRLTCTTATTPARSSSSRNRVSASTIRTGPPSGNPAADLGLHRQRQPEVNL